MSSGQFIFFGLEGYENKITELLNQIKSEQSKFEVQLIINELLSNAFLHGNKGNKDMPIELNYILTVNKIEVEVKDCGTGLSKVNIPKEINEDDLLKESGRGLYLVQCFAEVVKLAEGEIKIVKNIL